MSTALTPETDNPALATTFRELMANVCTPVSVVTAMDDHRPHGSTVSAFASLSMDPPMVLVSLNAESRLLTIIRKTGRFGLNILAADQSAHAGAFASRSDDRFAGISWDEDHQVPRLGGVLGWLACEVADLIDGGDHVIALGHVLATQNVATDPLTYHLRAFGTHTTRLG
ncbi:MAG: flavin reductase family protein [Rhodococcus sp. (in: high G+C Gram-positive bacteria)]